MKTTTLLLVLALTLGMGCTNRNNSTTETKPEETSQDSLPKMKNLISIVEIPTDSFLRATRFYESILNVKIETMDMQGTQMGIFPGEEGSVSVVLIKGSDYKPSSQGPLVYLNGGEDLQLILNKVEKSGGKIIIPKTLIDPENGFFATFIDSEGNKLGVHSLK